MVRLSWDVPTRSNDDFRGTSTSFNLKVGRSSDSEEHEGSKEEFQYSHNKQNISAIFFFLTPNKIAKAVFEDK